MSEGKTITNVVWKNVEFDIASASEKNCNLVGFEECTDYDPTLFSNIKESTGHKSKKSTSKIAKIKKKQVNVQRNVEKPKNVESIDDINNTSEFYHGTWMRYGLEKPILDALCSLGYTEPTKIQECTLPSAIFGRRNILGAAETGSGKTLAFGLPIVNGILQLKQDCDSDEGTVERPLYGLILTPTRELAIQIKNHLKQITKYTDIKITVVVGGMAAVKQERLLNRCPEIVVATPGRLWELIQTGNEHLNKLDTIRYLAIDETDRMLEHGHFEELHNLLERLNFMEEAKIQRQVFVFSATLTLVHSLPDHLQKKQLFSKKIKIMTPEHKLKQIIDTLGIVSPKVVDISQGLGTSTTLTESRVNCKINEKDYYLYYFVKKFVGRTLVFCNSIGCVKRLSNLLSVLDCRPLPLHASMHQKQRIKNVERFCEQPESILIATDVAARGLDFPNVDHVLHYQTPRTSECYVHRSGRTARISKEGLTVLFIEPAELRNYLKLCKTLGKSEDIPMFPIEESYLTAVKERINLARDLDSLQLKVRKSNSEAGWLQKAADDMDIIVDDFITKFDTHDNNSLKKLINRKKKDLCRLLQTPIAPKGFNSKYPLMYNSSIELLNQKPEQEKAIDRVKNVVSLSAKNRKRKSAVIPLYKTNKRKCTKNDY